MTLRTARRSSLVDQVIDQLRDEIAGGGWPVGAKIPPEPVLSETLGVGRNTVREAVRALTHAGLLESRQGDGTYVRATSELSGAVRRRLETAELVETLEVRRGLEVEAARLAATRRTDADIAAIAVALARRDAAWAAGEHAAFVEADLAFHTAVVEATHNRVLTDLYHDFSAALRASIGAAAASWSTPTSRTAPSPPPSKRATPTPRPGPPTPAWTRSSPPPPRPPRRLDAVLWPRRSTDGLTTRQSPIYAPTATSFATPRAMRSHGPVEGAWPGLPSRSESGRARRRPQ